MDVEDLDNSCRHLAFAFLDEACFPGGTITPSDLELSLVQWCKAQARTEQYSGVQNINLVHRVLSGLKLLMWDGEEILIDSDGVVGYSLKTKPKADKKRSLRSEKGAEDLFAETLVYKPDKRTRREDVFEQYCDFAKALGCKPDKLKHTKAIRARGALATRAAGELWWVGLASPEE